MSLPVTRDPYPFADTVGLSIRTAREEQRLSVKKLSDKARVSRRHLAELEKGSNVTLLVVRDTMRALGVTAIALGEEQHLTSGAATVHDPAALRDVANKLEQGLALIAEASAAIQRTAPSSASDRDRHRKKVRSPLAAKAASLITEFEAHVQSLDSEEKIDALQRLVQASLEAAPASRHKRSRRGRNASAAGKS